MLVPSPKPHGWQRLIQRITALRPVAAVLRPILSGVDRRVLSWTSGKYSLTYLLAGLPVIELTTTGAKSGLPRTTYLAAIVSGEQIGLIGTALGSDHNPAWTYNLRAHLQATVTYQGVSADYQAHLAEQSEWDQFWQLALTSYPGYRAYRQRITTRQIPIFVLTPLEAHPESQSS
jgi:deazaflavin-dependent oxidoreductase (nitroreductase family)